VAVAAGYCAFNIANDPDTCGDAIDVPLKLWYRAPAIVE
jgi:hypothetical protein